MSLPLIEIPDKAACVPVLIDSTIEKLKRCDGKCLVVAVVGPARSGKSFLLNSLIGQNDIFKVANSGVVSCGASITEKPIRVSTFMDTHKIKPESGEKVCVLMRN